MMPGSLARRYARALISLATSPGQRDKFAADLASFDDLVHQPDEQGRPVLAILQTRRFPVAERTKLVEVLCERISADPMTVKFLSHLVARDRIDGVSEINRAYRRMADDVAGRLQAEVTSTTPLSPEILGRLTQALEKNTGKTIVMTTRLDPELLGGVVAKVGSYIIDGSVRTALARMGQELHS